MRARIFTAMVLATVLVAVLLYGPAWAARALFGLFIAAGAWEWSGFLGVTARAARMGYVLSGGGAGRGGARVARRPP